MNMSLNMRPGAAGGTPACLWQNMRIPRDDHKTKPALKCDVNGGKWSRFVNADNNVSPF
jgi:hypothetical protein